MTAEYLCLTFFQDTALGRQAKLFVCMLSVENKIDTFRSAAPPYQLSEELKVRIISNILLMASMLNALQTNITNYSIAVMLSASVSAYKGDIPRNHVLVCLLLIV